MEIQDHLKSDLTTMKFKEQTYSSELQEANDRLINEQAILEDIQRQLNDAVKRLQPPKGL